jgi:hypothetical protein
MTDLARGLVALILIPPVIVFLNFLLPLLAWYWWLAIGVGIFVIALELREPEWWKGCQATLAGVAICLGFAACLLYLFSLFVGAALELSATLGMSHWYGWLGLGFFGLTLGVCVGGEESGPCHRARRGVIPRPAPPQRIEAMGGGNSRVTAEERWGRAA